MNTFNKITFALFTATVILVPVSLSWADMDISGSTDTLIFEQTGNMISFAYNQTDGDAASLGTCAMNPMNSSSSFSAAIEEYPIFTPDAYAASDSFDQLDPPLTSTTVSTNSSVLPLGGSQLPPIPALAAQNSEAPVTPEPATMLIFGLGLAGLGLARRRK